VCLDPAIRHVWDVVQYVWIGVVRFILLCGLIGVVRIVFFCGLIGVRFLFICGLDRKTVFINFRLAEHVGRQVTDVATGPNADNAVADPTSGTVRELVVKPKTEDGIERLARQRQCHAVYDWRRTCAKQEVGNPVKQFQRQLYYQWTP